MAINGINNPVQGMTQTTSAQAIQANPAQRSNLSGPDMERLDAIRAEQRQWIDGQRQIMRQLNSQIIGLTLANAQPNNTHNASDFNNLYNLAGMSRIPGAAGLQDYFSMFVRDGSGNFSVDFSGVSPEVQEQLIARAQEDVSENGFWGVDRTSERIFNFAEALTGGDPAKMAKMQRVVERAFESVGRMLGGRDRMPEISRQTHDAVMQRFNEFAAVTTENRQTTDSEPVAK